MSNEQWMNHVLTTSTFHLQVPTTFPCDNFICLLQKFQLLKTENGYLVEKKPSKQKPENCVHFQCWLKKFQISQTSFGFEFTDKDQLGKPPFSNTNDFSIFQSPTAEEGTYNQVVPQVQPVVQATTTSTSLGTQTLYESDLSDAALDDFFENYEYEEFNEW